MRIFRRKHSSPTETDTHIAADTAEELSQTQPEVPGAEHESSEQVEASLLASLSIEPHDGIPRTDFADVERDRPSHSEPAHDKSRAQRRIWDLESEGDTDSPRLPSDAFAPEVAGPDALSIEADDVALARARVAQFSQAGLSPAVKPSAGQRTKTRLLGFQSADLAQKDPFAGPPKPGACFNQPFPVGWVVVIDGPGRGACFTLTNGVANIGRGEEQAICLDFGDCSISRSNHAAIAYDDEANRFFLGQGGKSNIVRLNGRPVLSTEDLAHGDRIRIGETSLQFVAFCGEDFSWSGSEPDKEFDDAARQ